MHVMVVDDTQFTRMLVCDLLQHNGHTTHEAWDMNSARASLNTETPDIILMDVHFPGGDGVQLLHEARKNSRLNHIPIIAFTASAMEGDRQQLLNAGFDGYLVKPIDTKTFVQELKEHIAARQSP